MDVYFYEAFEEEADALKACMPAGVEAGYTWQTIQEAGHHVPPAPIISVRTQSALPRAWAPELKAILSRSTGYDHLVRYREAAGDAVALGYLPLYCNRAVAEQALLLWMALLRRLPRQRSHFETFDRDGLTGAECAGKTLLVVGVGHIGYEIVRIGQGLDMRVLGVDLAPRHDDVVYVAVDEGLSQADIVVSSMNLTAQNAGYFSAERLARCRPGALFINIARGEQALPSVLLKALDAGVLGGVGLDVYAEENDLAVALRAGETPATSEARAVLSLAKRPDVILTPHNAFNSAEAVRRKSEHSARQIAFFHANQTFLWPVP